MNQTARANSDDSQSHMHDGEGGDIKPRVLLFFDYACSFCYVDHFRFDKLASEKPIDLILCPFELRPGMPEEGISISGHELGHSERVDEYLYRVAREEGFPLVMPDLLPKTHLALTLGEYGRDAGPERHRELHGAIFHAHFGEGLDIGSREVLLVIATAHGFDSEDVIEAWDRDLYDERLHQFRHVALQLGVEATPAALICNELLIGSRPYQVFSEAVDRCLLTPQKVEVEVE